MYRVLLERSAERDLGRLSVEVHDRVIVALRALATACAIAAKYIAELR